MPELSLHGRKVNSVFQLLGEKENDLTYSVAWGLAQSQSFLNGFLELVDAHKTPHDDLSISLQRHEKDAGFTDIEIESNDYHIIVEAKRGWNLPGVQQLEKYASRLNDSVAPNKRLVVLSECSQEYALTHLAATEVSGLPILPVSWNEVLNIAKDAQAQGSNAEKRLTKELITYLGGVVTMQASESNWVYVVSLGKEIPENWGISWIDIVEKRSKYFHPVGGRGWPKDPPNYIAFRYGGRLQSIHHIDGYVVFTNPHDHFQEIPEGKWPRHFLYTLGPPLKPPNIVKTGKLYRNGRVRCMLDTLFVSETIAEARDLSNSRIK